MLVKKKEIEIIKIFKQNSSTRIVLVREITIREARKKENSNDKLTIFLCD